MVFFFFSFSFLVSVPRYTLFAFVPARLSFYFFTFVIERTQLGLFFLLSTRLSLIFFIVRIFRRDISQYFHFLVESVHFRNFNFDIERPVLTLWPLTEFLLFLFELGATVTSIAKSRYPKMIQTATSIQTSIETRARKPYLEYSETSNPLGLATAIENQIQEVSNWRCQRPKSAGVGATTRSFSRPRPVNGEVGEPRCSRDLPRSGHTIDFRAGLDTFSFPTPSPYMPAKSAMFQAKPSPLKDSSPLIGVAIGSPSQRFGWGISLKSQRSPRLLPPSRAPPPVPVPVEDDRSSTQPKTRRAKWKTLGNMFRRAPKSAVHPTFPESQLKRDTFQQSNHSSVLLPSPTFEIPPVVMPARDVRPVPSRSFDALPLALSGRQLKSRYEEGQTSPMPNTQPKILPPPSPLRIMISSAQVSPLEEDFKTEKVDSPLQLQSAISYNTSPDTPRLELNILNSQMERYSVMFEKLLKTTTTTTTATANTTTKPSLLERRQSRLKAKLMEGYEKPPITNLKQSIVDSRATDVSHCNKSTPLSGIPALSITVATTNTNNNNMLQVPPSTASLCDLLPMKRSNTGEPISQSPISAGLLRPTTIAESLSVSPASFTSSGEGPRSAVSSLTQDADVSPAKRGRKLFRLTSEMVRSGPTSPTDLNVLRSYDWIKSPTLQVFVAKTVTLSIGSGGVQSPTRSKSRFRPRMVELRKGRKGATTLVEAVGG